MVGRTNGSVSRRQQMHRFLGLLAVCAALSCRGRGASGGADGGVATAGDAAPAVPFAVRDDATELLFVWFDAQGVAHPARHIDEIPAARREAVRVDPTRPDLRMPGWVYLADLRQRGADGRYPARAVPAEALAGAVLAMAGHQGALGSTPTAPTAPTAPLAQGADAGAPAASTPVIIYGASWCSACHQAADYLRRRRVAFVEKDIEQDPAAAQEMMDKARRAGVPTGSIPILDVRGRIMAGFSAPAIDAALGG
ncbi:MAG: glutaredoxin domain-containing protein [Polyangiales bacterium]